MDKRETGDDDPPSYADALVILASRLNPVHPRPHPYSSLEPQTFPPPTAQQLRTPAEQTTTLCCSPCVHCIPLQPVQPQQQQQQQVM